MQRLPASPAGRPRTPGDQAPGSPTSSATRMGLLARSFSDEAGRRDLWDIYEQHYHDVEVALRRVIEQHPEFASAARALPTGSVVEQTEASRDLIRRALLFGEWENYQVQLRAQGEFYARIGLGLDSCFTLLATFRTALRPFIREEFAADRDRISAAIEALEGLTDLNLAEIGEAYLRAKEELIRYQQQAIQELSTPVLQLRDGLLLLPVIGALESRRARQLTDQLLQSIRSRRAKIVVLDLTGVPAVDSAVANHLIQTVQAARLLGARAVLTGLSAENAETLVRIGVDLSSLNTLGDLQDGIEEAERFLGYHLVRESENRSPDPRAKDGVQ